MYYEKLIEYGLRKKVAKRSEIDDLLELIAYNSNNIKEFKNHLTIISNILPKNYKGSKNYALDFSNKVYDLAKEYRIDMMHIFFNIIKLEDMEAAICIIDIPLNVLQNSRNIIVHNETSPKELVYNGQSNLVLSDKPYFDISFQIYGTGEYFVPGTISFELPLHVQSTHNVEDSPISNLPYHLNHLLSLFHDSQNHENERIIQIGSLLQKGFNLEECNSLKILKMNDDFYLEMI